MGARSVAGAEEEWSRGQAADPAEFARMIEAIRAEADPETALPPGIVHQTVLWFVDGVDWLGRLSIRHHLTPALTELGGHIGYYVRPSARRQGHATQMLTQSLPIAGRPRNRSRAGHLRPGQRGLAPRDRVGRWRIGRRTTRKAALLGTDTDDLMSYRRAHEGRHPDA